MSVNYYSDAFKNKSNPPKDTRPSVKGYNVIVTGANVGLGFEAALKWVQLGANKVILAVRTLSKGEEAKRKIDSQTGLNNVTEVWPLDMLDYESIKAFAARANNELDHLEITCLNAGLVALPFQTSTYGYEATMQVNVLSTALLSLLLIPKLRASKTANYTPVLEIVGSSNAYIVSKLASTTAPFAAYNEPKNWSVQLQYSVSKLFVNYVQEALLPLVANKETGKPDVDIVVVCPGSCQSDLGRNAKAWYFVVLLWLLKVLIQRTTEEGARTYISGAENAENVHGKFWKDDKARGPAPLQQGEEGKRLQKTVWKEVIEALIKDVPKVKQLAGL